MTSFLIPKGTKIPKPGTVDFADWMVLTLAAFFQEVQDKTKATPALMNQMSVISCIRTDGGKAADDKRRSKLFTYGSNRCALDSMQGMFNMIVANEIRTGKPPMVAMQLIAREIMAQPRTMGEDDGGVTFNNEQTTPPESESKE